MNDTVYQRIRDSAKETREGALTTLSFRAMGTQCRVVHSAEPTVGCAFRDAALQWVAEFESRYSRFLPDSLISQINREAGRGWVTTDDETDRLLAYCNEAHFLTRGVFDPTALPLIQLWDWKRARSHIPCESEISEAMKRVGWRKVQRARGRVFLPEAGMSLDFGGIGKEYAVDCVARLAAEHGMAGAVVDFGQDVLAFGQPPEGRPAWKIGLENPDDPGKIWTALAIKNRAVASSGDYLRHFEIGGRRFGHIIDVRTGWPVNNGCRAVSVVGANCTVAGLLSTAAFVLGPEEGLKLIESQYQAEGCLVMEKQKLMTRRFHEYVTR